MNCSAHRLRTRPTGRRLSDCCARSSGSALVPPIRNVLQQDTRPTTSRCLDSSNGCGRWTIRRSLSVCPGLTRTHARDRRDHAMDREAGRADTLAFALPGFATGETSRTTRSLARAGGYPEIISATPPVDTQSAIRTGWRKVANDATRERLRFPYRQPARGIVLGTGDLSSSWHWVGRHTVSATDVALQRQRRCAQDADPAPDPVGHFGG